MIRSKPMRARAVALTSVLVIGAGCGGANESNTQPNGGVGDGGTAGTGGGAAGKVGLSAGTGGSSAGRGGTAGAAAGGSSGAGMGGTTSGAGASAAGTSASSAGAAGRSGAPAGGAGAGASGTSGTGGAAGMNAAGAAPGGRGGAAGTSGGMGGRSAGGAGGATGGAGAGGAIGAIDTTGVTTSCPGAVPSGITATWCSCEQWGETTGNGFTYYNDIWGTSPGPQCIWLTSSGLWGVTSKHPTTSNIKSYPNVSLSPQKAISSINTYTSSFDVLVPNGGVYETSYDIWVKGTTSARIEIMLWVTYHGGNNPVASAYTASGAVADATNVNVGGHTWNVYYGSNGSNDVASFLRTSNANSGSVDIKAILAWIIANNQSKFAKFTASYTLDQVQFGHEIASDGNTQAYVTKSFSVTSN